MIADPPRHTPLLAASARRLGHRRGWLFLGALWLAAGAAWPALAMLSEEDFLGEVPVVLSGTRLAQPVSESPAAITVIDREMIEASGLREIPQLLRLVPGFQVGEVNGHAFTVTYHGLADEFSRRMQVLIDGRSVYSPGIGGVEWSELALTMDDIDRIEVIRGPNAATHGSNAFSGVISIVTRHPSEDPALELRVNRGGQGIGDAFLRHAGAVGDLDYRLSLGFRSDDGLPTRHDTKRVRLANLHLDYPLGSRDRLELQLGHSEGPREVGFGENDRQQRPATDERLRQFQLLRWRRSVDADNDVTLQLYHNRESLDETQRGLALAAPLVTRARVHRYDVEAYQTLRPSERLRAVWGGSLRRDEVFSPTFFATRKTFVNRVRRVFGNLEWRATPRLLVHAGAMWENNDFTPAEVSPRLALNYRLAPGHSLRASLSTAERTPIFFEDRADFRVPLAPPPAPPVTVITTRGNLDAERIFSRELGYVGSFPAVRLTLDLKLYRDRLSRLLRLSDGLPQQWSNQGSATVTGLETHLNWRPTSADRLVLSHAWADTDSDDRALEQSTPRNTLSLLGVHRLGPRMTASAAYYLVSRQRWLGSGDLIPQYRRLDLRLAREFRIGRTRGQLAAIVQNVLGDYQDFRFDPRDPTRRNVFETRAYLSLVLRF